MIECEGGAKVNDFRLFKLKIEKGGSDDTIRTLANSI